MDSIKYSKVFDYIFNKKKYIHPNDTFEAEQMKQKNRLEKFIVKKDQLYFLEND